MSASYDRSAVVLLIWGGDSAEWTQGFLCAESGGDNKEVTDKRRILWYAAVAALLFGGRAWSQECAVTIEGNDQIQYSKSELRVSADCDEITVTLKHVGTLAANIMGHNWVLTKAADYMAVAQAGQSVPPNYVPAGDDRVIAATNIIGGGEETTISFDAGVLEKGGDYMYFCSFPGHFVLMYGKFVVA